MINSLLFKTIELSYNRNMVKYRLLINELILHYMKKLKYLKNIPNLQILTNFYKNHITCLDIINEKKSFLETNENHLVTNLLIYIKNQNFREYC